MVLVFTVVLHWCAFIDFICTYSQFTLALLGRQSSSQFLWFAFFSNRSEEKHCCE